MCIATPAAAKKQAKQAAWRQANVEKVAAYKAAWRERRKVARLLP